MDEARPPEAVFSRGGTPLDSRSDRNAEFPHSLDGGRAPLDARCEHQYHNGAVPGVCGRHAPSRAEEDRVRDAEPPDRPGVRPLFRAPLGSDKLVRRNEYARGEPHPPDGASRVFHRLGRVRGGGPLHDRPDPGVSSGRPRSVPRHESGLLRRRPRVPGDFPRDPLDAEGDATARACSVLHLVRTLLHVDLLCPRGRDESVRGGPGFTGVPAGE